MPWSIFRSSGRASAAGGGMATEASKSPTTSIVPRRMKASDAIDRPVMTMARTIQRRRVTPGSIRRQSVYKSNVLNDADLAQPGHIG
jgi:hypothetical protein